MKQLELNLNVPAVTKDPVDADTLKAYIHKNTYLFRDDASFIDDIADNYLVFIGASKYMPKGITDSIDKVLLKEFSYTLSDLHLAVVNTSVATAMKRRIKSIASEIFHATVAGMPGSPYEDTPKDKTNFINVFKVWIDPARDTLPCAQLLYLMKVYLEYYSEQQRPVVECITLSTLVWGYHPKKKQVISASNDRVDIDPAIISAAVDITKSLSEEYGKTYASQTYHILTILETYCNALNKERKAAGSEELPIVKVKAAVLTNALQGCRNNKTLSKMSKESYNCISMFVEIYSKYRDNIDAYLSTGDIADMIPTVKLVRRVRALPPTEESTPVPTVIPTDNTQEILREMVESYRESKQNEAQIRTRIREELKEEYEQKYANRIKEDDGKMSKISRIISDMNASVNHLNKQELTADSIHEVQYNSACLYKHFYRSIKTAVLE